YISTTIEVMRSGAKHGRRVIVLDRPNPIGGAMQGNILDPAFRSFIGPLVVPMRHGLTLGEQARLANRELEIGADLVVVPAEHWTRNVYGDATGLPFVAPSPNLQSVESLFHYPGTCLFEGTALSVGRGTPAAYRQIGAPWLDTTRVLALVRAARLPGVSFEGVGFTPVKPGDAKYPDVALRGIRLSVTDRATYDPTRTGVVLLTAIRSVHPDSLGFIQRHFDLLAGGSSLRQAILADRSADAIVAEWIAPRQAFEARIKPILLYR
ncbi:MAG: exo-beta-N-acetylmuramidase NamZ family protein, partial [Gemmatimonadales bacterium]